MLWTRDNLGVNDCIICAEERELDRLVAAGDETAAETTVSHVGCCAHSAVLPLYGFTQSDRLLWYKYKLCFKL